MGGSELGPNMQFTFFLQHCSGSPIGDDGRTHQGASNISNLCSIPHMVVAVTKDEGELQQLLSTATKAGCPMAVSYPRGNRQGMPLQPDPGSYQYAWVGK